MAGNLNLSVNKCEFHQFFDADPNRYFGPRRISGDVVLNNREITLSAGQFEARQTSPLLAIALGPTQIMMSSSCSSWRGILLERHLYIPGERVSGYFDKHVISMFHGSPSRLEYRNLGGEFVAAVIRPRSIMITPPGLVPDVLLHTSAEVTHCALEPEFLRSVAEELNCPVGDRPYRTGVEDKSIQQILGMLGDELEADRPLGRLYVDSLAHALATRYLLLDLEGPGRSKTRVTGLVPRILKRIRDKVEANLDSDLSLESLAEESGYSRAHFLRAFRAATGVTPHRYVLDLRLRSAQDRLSQSKSSIIDVALSCGFSSQSHMTSVFRRHLEMTPGEFRRNARN